MPLNGYEFYPLETDATLLLSSLHASQNHHLKFSDLAELITVPATFLNTSNIPTATRTGSAMIALQVGVWLMQARA